jgi:hypothetical protein
MQIAGYVHKRRNIVVVKLKVLQFKQVFNVTQVACYQVIHANNMVIFFINLSHKCEPKKPAAPVIKIRLRLPLILFLFVIF